MQKLKINFHLHTKQDPLDSIKHTEKGLITAAANLGYDVLAITCHNALIFSEDLQKFASQHRILLIPGIEKTIEGKHVLIINAHIAAQKIKSFVDLKAYRHHHPESFVIAAHPYYPGPTCLQKKLVEHIDLFDAIEYSWYHSKKFNQYNAKAIKTGEKYNLPVIGTADNHNIKYLNSTYTIVKAEKTPKAIFEAIKKGDFEVVSHDLPAWKLPFIISGMLFSAFIKRFLLK